MKKCKELIAMPVGSSGEVLENKNLDKDVCGWRIEELGVESLESDPMIWEFENGEETPPEIWDNIIVYYWGRDGQVYDKPQQAAKARPIYEVDQEMVQLEDPEDMTEFENALAEACDHKYHIRVVGYNDADNRTFEDLGHDVTQTQWDRAWEIYTK